MSTVEIKDVYDFLKRPPLAGGQSTPNFSSLQESLLQSDFLETLMQKMVKSIGKEAQNLSGSIVESGTKLSDEISKFASKNLSGVLRSMVGDTPFSAMDLVGQVGEFNKTYFASNFELVGEKIKVVEHALSKLGELIGLPTDNPLLSKIQESITQSLKLFSNGNLGSAANDFLTSQFLPSKGSMSAMMEGASNGKWMNWVQMPRALKPGAFYEWISNESNYRNASDPQSRRLELAYRTLLADAVAKYLMSNTPGELQDIMSSKRLSFQSLSDLVRTIISQTIRYVFEPENFDLYGNGIDYYEDACKNFCAGLSGQLDTQLRGTIGTMLRGAWEFSVHSDAIAEIIATTVATFFSNFLRSITFNLLSTIQLVPRYVGDASSMQFVDDFLSIERAEWKGQSGPQYLRIEYLLVARDAISLDSSSKLGSTVVEIIKDFVAYLDMYHQTWRVTEAFKEQAANSTRKIGVLQPRLQGNVLTVNATVLGTHPAGSPRPIFRAYFGDRVFLLRPSGQTGNSYVGEYEFFARPLRNFELHVVNSAGGYARQEVSI